MKIIPWILVLLLGGGAYFFYSKNQEKEREVAELRSDLKKLQSQLDELQDSAANPIDQHEIDRLRKEAEEVYKLRGEISQLRREKLQNASQQERQQNPAFQAAAQNNGDDIDDVFADSTPKTPEDAAKQKLENERALACVEHLKNIEEAKTKWATGNNKTGGSQATEADVLPFLQNARMPVCPSGGTYSVNEVGVPAHCSVEMHSLLP